jgi:FKBP-type peptidyl-prolyl cis-trans isomerase
MTTFFHARHVATLWLTLLAALGGAAACKNHSSAGGSDAAPAKDGGATAAAAPSGLPAPPDVAEPPADATKTASGLAFKILTPGSGTEHPSQNDQVKVNYSGWTTDGKMFDSTITRGKPTQFPLNRVIKGWTEGLQLMKVGDKMRFWIPAKLAYEDPDMPKRAGAPQGMLVFDVELLNVMAAPPGGGMQPPRMQQLQQQQLQQQQQQLQGQH